MNKMLLAAAVLILLAYLLRHRTSRLVSLLVVLAAVAEVAVQILFHGAYPIRVTSWLYAIAGNHQVLRNTFEWLIPLAIHFITNTPTLLLLLAIWWSPPQHSKSQLPNKTS